MAKKRKDPDKEDEDKPFKMPKFDEEAFVKKERKNIKATFIAFFFACLVALISFGFWALMSGESSNLRWPLVLVFGIFTASFIRYIYLRLGLDVSHFTKKNWFTTYAIYIFVWLIVLIVLVNPPFYDDETPKVELVVLPGMQEPGGDILIIAKITDNTGMDKNDIILTIDDVAIPAADFEFFDNVFRYTYPSPDNVTDDESHDIKLIATDSSGHKTEKIGNFVYSNDTITLAEPDVGEAVDANDDIRFRVNTYVHRVYYTVDDGPEINASKKTDSDTDYETFPEYEGWPADLNAEVNVTVYAEIIHYFENHIADGDFVKFSNIIQDNDVYNFTIKDDDDIGEKASEAITVPKGRFVGAPGFEAIVFIVALLAVVLIFKYKKKDRRN